MAVGLSDLRQHLGEKLAAKKTALVETEESLRYGSDLDIKLSRMTNSCSGNMWVTAQWTSSREAGE